LLVGIRESATEQLVGRRSELGRKSCTFLINWAAQARSAAERAMSFWPNKGDPDLRPSLGSTYKRIPAIMPHKPIVPESAPGGLRCLLAAEFPSVSQRLLIHAEGVRCRAVAALSGTTSVSSLGGVRCGLPTTRELRRLLTYCFLIL
jgi:hypothetical protein